MVEKLGNVQSFSKSFFKARSGCSKTSCEAAPSFAERVEKRHRKAERYRLKTFVQMGINGVIPLNLDPLNQRHKMILTSIKDLKRTTWRVIRFL